MKPVTLSLLQIGKTGTHSVKLDPDYREGLLHLDSFSHALVLYEKEGSLHYTVISIKQIDYSTGTISTDKSQLLKGLIVYDIKPYFPCEDYIRDCDFRGRQTNPSIVKINDGEIMCKGTIIRKNGVYFLKFNDNTDPAIIAAQSSHIRIFWYFQRFDKPNYRRITQCDPPYENAPRSGVFSTRSPVRPNPIAMTSARILGMDGSLLKVSTLDCFDNTPLIACTAYVPETERIENARVPKWLDHWPDHVDDSDYRNEKILPVISPLIELLHAQKPSSARAPLALAEKNSPVHNNELFVSGARQNNLKSIQVRIPYGKITAISGVSGSGKSSLTFDTIYTECRRRYLDANGDEIGDARPDYDEMRGLIPAIAVSQKTISRNPRSSLGTVTGMHMLLRQLFCAIGVRHCPDCQEPITVMTRDSIVKFLSSYTGVQIHTLDGDVCAMPLADAVDYALEKGRGALYASIDGSQRFIMQTRQMCYHCGRIMFELTPSLFSFNDPESMCPVCGGRGITTVIDTDSIITDENISLLDGASRFHGKLRSFLKNQNHNWMKGEVFALAADLNVDLEKPWRDLPEKFRHEFIFGTGSRKVSLRIDNIKTGRSGDTCRPVEGVYHILERFLSERSASALSAFVKEDTCPSCQGERLSREGRMVSIAGMRFPQVCAMNAGDTAAWCTALAQTLSDDEYAKVVSILQQLYKVLLSCIDLGLGYLSLDRSVTTLSGGELQRIKLVCQLCGDISGILYLFDEPSAGLHPKDYERLSRTLYSLRDKGNTVVYVEHNRDLIASAQHVIEIGPGAGKAGGHVVFEGTVEQLAKTDCETGRYLSGQTMIPHYAKTGQIPDGPRLKISGAHCHNLKSLSAEFPVGAISCVTGVSGSGKSSLIKGVLYPGMCRFLDGDPRPCACEKIENANLFSSVVLADQSPIGRTPRSVPATYTGIMDELRKLFASTEDARRSEFQAGHFSFNSKNGQCDNCGGDGMIAAPYLDNVWIRCPVCEGKRYKEEILRIRWRDKNIFEILDMSVAEARELCADIPAISRTLKLLDDVGLSYLQLGQNSATLSGGEAQRLKLAKSFCAAKNANTLYLLDEPTSGLHGSDIAHLYSMLRALCDQGNTVIMIEHHIDLVACADHIVDIGPDGGIAGGSLVAMGTPLQIARCAQSRTGACLAKLFA